MKRSTAEMTKLMERAVAYGVEHVAAGGLPFVGVVAGDGGYVSGFGVNEVQRTGDPTAHAEIVAMRQALQDLRRTDLERMALLATGEPCGLCYRFALQHGIERVYVAVDAESVAELGFDYRASYRALGIDRSRLTDLVTALPVDGRMEPFTRHLRLDHTRP